MTKLVLADDYDGIYQRLDVMYDVVSVLEQVRKEAGILFPEDD
jgi:hypothetical protein